MHVTHISLFRVACSNNHAVGDEETPDIDYDADAQRLAFLSANVGIYHPGSLWARVSCRCTTGGMVADRCSTITHQNK